MMINYINVGDDDDDDDEDAVTEDSTLFRGEYNTPILLLSTHSWWNLIIFLPLNLWEARESDTKYDENDNDFIW